MPLDAPRSVHRLEVVLLHVVEDLLAEDGSLNIGGAEVNPAPDAGVDDLLSASEKRLKLLSGHKSSGISPTLDSDRPRSSDRADDGWTRLARAPTERSIRQR